MARTTTTVATCATCACWIEKGPPDTQKGLGTCHRHAKRGHGGWPRTHEDEFCMEWMPAEDEPITEGN
jgi:hypothetical protein